MCGIVGFCDFRRSNATEEWAAVGRRMGERLTHRGPDAGGVWQTTDAVLAHRRLAVIDVERGGQPMTRYRGAVPCTIVYNGEIYNAGELRRTLMRRGWRFETACDTEVVLTAYMEYGERVGEHLEGIFAFAIYDGLRRQLFLCRDRFGVKPLFYAYKDGTFLFASEQKALFEYPGVEPEIDREGWCEVLGLGPARTPGCGVFKGIRELLPAHYMTVTPEGIRQERWWSLVSMSHGENYEDTVAHVRELLTGAIQRQLVSDVPLCTFLSGGLDSSVITAVAARQYAAEGKTLTTYSFDYTDNERYFHPSDFQPDADAPWVRRMVETFGTEHKVLTCGMEDLAALLTDSMAAHDLPSMADVDSSLYYFCRQVAKEHVVAVSGECADEVFGGYPWFHRRELMECGTFPWCPDLSARTGVMRREVVERLGLADYVHERYEEWVSAAPRLDGETGEEKRRREIGWLNLNWFMATLLERKDRCSMASGLEVRVPFCDDKLVQYVWNIPWEMKSRNGERKSVLRDAAKGLLPEDVRNRPKSPYPKTHNPEYERLVREKLTAVLDDPNAPVKAIVDEDVLREGLLVSAGDYGRPWFGQLMAGPQMLAWLVQMNGWMERFHLSPPLS
ncbi:MAG: asparagine synthase (glutamine-hydrolyzing) [Oscillospiraceae bacterium]|nr:asparagine synthase (glutamine-hydrolyzing) [Oscillospiraceae bacterium]